MYNRNITIGLRLLELRENHNLNQSDLANALSITRAAYSYYETGRSTPDIYALMCIADFYNMTMDELLRYVDHKRKVTKISTPPVTSEDAFYDKIAYILKHKQIHVDDILKLTKKDFKTIQKLRELTSDGRQEIEYIINYKLRHYNSIEDSNLKDIDDIKLVSEDSEEYNKE